MILHMANYFTLRVGGKNILQVGVLICNIQILCYNLDIVPYHWCITPKNFENWFFLCLQVEIGVKDPDLVGPLERTCVCHFKIAYFSDGMLYQAYCYFGRCLRFITQQHVEKWVCFHLRLETVERKLFLIDLTDKGPIFTQGLSFPIIVVQQTL